MANERSRSWNEITALRIEVLERAPLLGAILLEEMNSDDWRDQVNLAVKPLVERVDGQLGPIVLDEVAHTLLAGGENNVVFDPDWGDGHSVAKAVFLAGFEIGERRLVSLFDHEVFKCFKRRGALSESPYSFFWVIVAMQAGASMKERRFNPVAQFINTLDLSGIGEG